MLQITSHNVPEMAPRESDDSVMNFTDGEEQCLLLLHHGPSLTDRDCNMLGRPVIR